MVELHARVQGGAAPLALTRGARLGAAPFLFLIIASLTPASCTILAATDAEQCLTDADCAARGADFAGLVCTDNTCQPPPTPPDPIWGCIGHVNPPTTEPFTATIVVKDAISQMAVPSPGVKLCSKLDPACTMPFQVPKPGADGTFSATIPSDANDYFQIIAPDYLPSLHMIDTGGGSDTANVSLVTPAVQVYLNNTLGITADPKAGSLNVGVNNCKRERAKGVHFELNPKGASVAYYAISSVLSPTATETDVIGNGGFINAPAGVVTLTATVQETGQVIGSVTTLVIAGAITFQPMRPTPLP